VNVVAIGAEQEAVSSIGRGGAAPIAQQRGMGENIELSCLHHQPFAPGRDGYEVRT